MYDQYYGEGPAEIDIMIYYLPQTLCQFFQPPQ